MDEEECERGAEGSGCTLVMATRIPTGIGSLAYDKSLGASPAHYFTAAFIGTTREHITTTQNSLGDPEDRIFLIRRPILQTVPPTVTKNWIQMRVLTNDIFDPQTLLDMEEENPAAAAGGAGDSRARRLQQWARRPRRRASDSSSSEEGCLSARRSLLDEPFAWKPFMGIQQDGQDGFSFCFPIWPTPPLEVW